MTEEVTRRALLDEATAWALLIGLAAQARAGRPVREPCGLDLTSAGELECVALGAGLVDVDPACDGGLASAQALAPAVAELFALYLPLCLGSSARARVVAHVGQSLDGRIATPSGASRYVTGPENIRHLHRLRALSDAVLVGAGTVEHDDPRLTTRLVQGENPVRVVVDPTLRLPRERALFQDGAAQTFVVCARERVNGQRWGRAELVPVDARAGMLPPAGIVAALAELGLSRLFVEGGGVTVSRFLEARALDRLQVTIGPLFIGQGRPGICLPAIETLDAALRPRTRRFHLGEDVLFDCAFDRGG